MADVFDKEKRSQIMSAIHSKQNKSTEIKLIAIFTQNNITGWRRNYNVKGHPDFVFINKKIAVFVDGCFWHGHDCRNTRPLDNAEYWQKKRERNIQHDKEITFTFEKRGWTVIRIWECELKKSSLFCINKLFVLGYYRSTKQTDAKASVFCIAGNTNKVSSAAQ